MAVECPRSCRVLVTLIAILLCCLTQSRGRVPTNGEHWKKDIMYRLEHQNYGNNAPLIGVLAQPHNPKHSKKGAKQSISGPLVSWIESAGGRVVPIRYDSTEQEVERIFESLNGIVFPGGSGTLWYGHQFFDTAAHLWRLAKKANLEDGEIFPVFGICLGFETLHILIANRTSDEVLVPAVGQESVANTLELTGEADDSIFFSNWDESLLRGVADPRLRPTFNAHEWAVPLDAYDAFEELREELTILSTSTDVDGNLYVSTAEGTRMPIFATQYHPEKPNFEFSDTTIPHTRTAGDVGYSTAQVFVETAKLNARQIPYEDQVDIVIQNYERVFIAADPEEIKDRDPLPDSVWMIPDDAGKIPHRGDSKVLVH